MSEAHPVLLSRRGAIAKIELNDPPYNRLGVALFDELEAAVTELAEDDSVRVLLLTAAGGQNFSVGADIREFGTTAAARGMREVIEQRHGAIRQIETMSKPSICLIRGACMGGGLEIAMACHFRLGSSDARLGLPEVELGVLPGWGGTQRLTRLVGRARALEILLRAQKLSAQEALEAGLLGAVCDPEELDAQGMALAEELAAKAPLAVAGILEAVILGGEASLEEGLAREFAALERCAQSEDMIEGITAFLQKRAPVFKGR